MKRTAYRSRDSYAQVNWEMVKEVGGDITLAVVFDWITWKADPTYDGVEDEDGTAWYAASVATLAETMNVSEKVIRRALSELVRLGHLAVAELRINGPYDRTKSYRPVWESEEKTPAAAAQTDVETPAEEGDSTCPTGQMGVALQGNSELPSGANVPLFETYTEVTNKELFDAPAPAVTIEQFFEAFWNWYPRHEAKKPALAKFIIAAKKHSPAALVQAAIDYNQNPHRPQDPKHVPYAATWLHQERWTDEIAASPAPATGPRKLTNAELALAEYNERYGDSNGHAAAGTPALDPGLGDRQSLSR
ncbi:hypothetical protein C5E11_04020 [Clavibacter michiganensis]|nr:helix-turn-helix domain-containing protein [Clavibacter michiganensis]PPF64564.1 hypothetical protein C5E11_04020 [Clavibacter michiganensis]